MIELRGYHVNKNQNYYTYSNFDDTFAIAVSKNYSEARTGQCHPRYGWLISLVVGQIPRSSNSRWQ